MIKHLLILFTLGAVASALLGCNGPLSSVSPTPVSIQISSTFQPTATASATATSTPTASLTPTLTPTRTPEPTITPTEIPEELRNQLLQSYGTTIFIQGELELIDEITTQVISGHMDKVDAFAAIIVLSVFIDKIDESLKEFVPHPFYTKNWHAIIKAHEFAKFILSDWFNKKIKPEEANAAANKEISLLLPVILDIETALAKDYRIDKKVIVDFRNETADSLRAVFATPTPAP